MSRDRSFQFPHRPSELLGNVATEYGSQEEAVAGKRHLRWATSKSLWEASPREPVEAGQCIAQGKKSEDLFTGMQMMRARRRDNKGNN